VVACPTQANIFGDLDDPDSKISRFIAAHPDTRVRKPEKGTEPKHFYTGAGEVHLNPLASKREEGPSLFGRLGTLDHVGKE
jgi:tetrathionate reductase subunit B